MAAGAPDALLDTYNSERHPVAATTLRFTDLATRGLIAARSPVLRAARRHVVPRVLTLGPVQRRLRNALSQLEIRYGPSAVVVEDLPHLGRLGAPRSVADRLLARRDGPAAGERAPDASLSDSAADPVGRRLFDVFRDPRHVLLIFEGRSGDASERRRLTDLAESIEDAYGRLVLVRRVRLDGASPSPAGSVLADANGEAHERYGATQPCFYVVRPDGFVALRGTACDGERLEAYLGKLGAAARTSQVAGG